MNKKKYLKIFSRLATFMFLGLFIAWSSFNYLKADIPVNLNEILESNDLPRQNSGGDPVSDNGLLVVFDDKNKELLRKLIEKEENVKRILKFPLSFLSYNISTGQNLKFLFEATNPSQQIITTRLTIISPNKKTTVHFDENGITSKNIASKNISKELGNYDINILFETGIFVWGSGDWISIKYIRDETTSKIINDEINFSVRLTLWNLTIIFILSVFVFFGIYLASNKLYRFIIFGEPSWRKKIL